MKVVLITGAAGFLGSHLADEMLRRGHRVIGLDNLSHGNLRNLEQARLYPGFSFHRVDVCDMEAVQKAVVGRVDMILHLAAFKIPRYGNVSQTLLVNSQGTLNLLRLAADRGSRFLITSTSDVYGKNPKIPFAEDDDLVLGPSTVARWAYAASKLFDEHLILAMSQENGFSATAVRIFGSYGPRQHLSWWGGPQSVFIDAILRDQMVPIHGDGRQTRSFTFVADTVRGIADAAESNDLNGEILNIGNDVEVNVLELAETIHRLSGVPWLLRVQMVPYDQISGKKYEDVRRRVPDLRKAKRTIGFTAMFSLEEGLRKTIDWQRALTSQATVVSVPEPALTMMGARE
jgi:UDP-glucose 4-epimerase